MKQLIGTENLQGLDIHKNSLKGFLDSVKITYVDRVTQEVKEVATGYKTTDLNNKLK